MKSKEALDHVVQHLTEIDSRLSGEDSPLSNPWEEIKEQLQNELSPYWLAYLETIRGSIAGLVSSLSAGQSSELAASMKCDEGPALERTLLRRLLARGKKEKVVYAPFDFVYFCYPLVDFTVYGRVIERTGLDSLWAEVFSAASPYGEQGSLNANQIEERLTQEQFEQASASGWPADLQASSDGSAVAPSDQPRREVVKEMVRMISSYLEEGMKFADAIRDFQETYGAGARAFDSYFERAWQIKTRQTVRVRDVLGVEGGDQPPPVTRAQPPASNPALPPPTKPTVSQESLDEAHRKYLANARMNMLKLDAEQKAEAQAKKK